MLGPQHLTGVHAGLERTGPAVADQFLGVAGEEVGGGVGLHAAVLAAGAQPAAGVDDHVPQFGAVLEVAAKHLAVDDDAAADAGAQREHDQVLDVLAGSGPELAPAGGIGVVLQRGPDARLVLHDLAERDVLHARQVARVDDQALAMAHGAGRADADADDLLAVDAGLGDGLLGGGR